MALTAYPLVGYWFEVMNNLAAARVVCDIRVKYKFEFKRLKGAFGDIS